jgi:hypothetical protein
VFGEYFNGDNAAALGASHQTGWTGLIADVIRRRYGLVRSIGEVIMLVDRENRGLCSWPEGAGGLAARAVSRFGDAGISAGRRRGCS